MKTEVIELCYPAGLAGWAAMQWAVATPLFLWAAAYGSYRQWGYRAALSANWALVVALHYLVAVGWDARQGGAPLAECNNNLRAMPDKAMWLLLHYLVLEEISRRWRREPLSWFGVASTLVHLVLVPAALLWTRNTRPLYALAGAGLGVASAALCGAVLVVVVAPALAELWPAATQLSSVPSSPPPLTLRA